MQQTSPFKKRFIGNAKNFINAAAFNRINKVFFFQALKRQNIERIASLSFTNSRVRQYPFVYQFIMCLLSHRRSGLWASSKQGVFETNRKSLLSFQDVLAVAKSFGLQRSASDFTAHCLGIRNSANYQDFLRPFFFQLSCSIHNTYQCGYIPHG